MFVNILYCLYFGVIAFILNALLTKSFRIEKNILLVLSVVILIVIILHTDFFEINFLMKSKDFFHLLNFSFGFVILYFGGKFQDYIRDKSKNKTGGVSQQTFKSFMIVVDFIRYKLIYVMIYIYQVLAIWNPKIR
jgi:hypothetical protein